MPDPLNYLTARGSELHEDYTRHSNESVRDTLARMRDATVAQARAAERATWETEKAALEVLRVQRYGRIALNRLWAHYAHQDFARHIVDFRDTHYPLHIPSVSVNGYEVRYVKGALAPWKGVRGGINMASDGVLHGLLQNIASGPVSPDLYAKLWALQEEK